MYTCYDYDGGEWKSEDSNPVTWHIQENPTWLHAFSWTFPPLIRLLTQETLKKAMRENPKKEVYYTRTHIEHICMK